MATLGAADAAPAASRRRAKAAVGGATGASSRMTCRCGASCAGAMRGRSACRPPLARHAADKVGQDRAGLPGIPCAQTQL